jgi:hypothetical protein
MALASRIAAAAALAVLASQAHAQDASLAGSWQGVVQVQGVRVDFALTVQPNGAFTETEATGTLRTMQSGEIRQTAPGVVTFIVEDWQPRTMPTYHATGTTGGFYTQTLTSKPPGGTWALIWQGQNTVTLRDVNGGGAVTFTRVG